MTEQPAEKRVETSPSTRSGRTRNARIHGTGLGLRRSLDSGRLKRRQALEDDLRSVDSRALDEQRSEPLEHGARAQADCDAIAAKLNGGQQTALLQDAGGVLCTSQVGESVRGTSVALRT